MDINFYDIEHEKSFYYILDKMKKADVFHVPLAYLFALDDVCFNNLGSLYDFNHDSIKPEVLFKGWQTSTSIRTTLFAFNLYTGSVDWCDDEELKAACTPENIFCCSYAPYYWEAIRLRYPEYTD